MPGSMPIGVMELKLTVARAPGSTCVSGDLQLPVASVAPKKNCGA